MSEGEKKESIVAEEGEGNVKKSKKKLFIIIFIVLLLCGGAAGAFFFMSSSDSSKDDSAITDESGSAKQQKHDSAEPIFYSLDEMTVTLLSEKQRSNLLMLRVTLELISEEDALVLDKYMPRVKDAMQSYLQNLKVSDVRRAGGKIKIKYDLEKRILKSLPRKIAIRDVLFERFIID